MSSAAHQRSPDAIERDVYETQDRISETFDELMNRLHPMDLMRSMFSSGSDTSSQAWDQARRNPLALGMIAAGMAWLFSGHDARPGALSRSHSRGNGADKHGGLEADVGYHDPHMAYVQHMAGVEQREGEVHEDYQRRRDTARGTYLMLERQHGEDDPTYRSRLDKATEDLRSRSSAFGERMKEMAHGAGSRASHAGSSLGHASGSAAQRSQSMFLGNPLVSGLLAAAIGAAAGASAPMSEAENETLGEAGEKARRAAQNKANAAADEANKRVAPKGDGGQELRH